MIRFRLRRSDPVDPGGLTALVERIRSGEIGGMEELYRRFSKAIRFYVWRRLGSAEQDDKVHDTFVLVVQAIRRGELREPERLMPFVRTVVRRLVAAHIERAIQLRKDQITEDSGLRIADPTTDPEQNAMFRQKLELIQQVLAELDKRDREILTRFYLKEQAQDRICTEMELTVTQFRLLKSRAKARFGELGKKRLAQGALTAICMRTSAGASH